MVLQEILELLAQQVRIQQFLVLRARLVLLVPLA
jgi:hypothetical protein